MPGRTCSGFSSPGGTAATVTLPLLPNSMVDIGLMVAPLVGVTKNTLDGAFAGAAAGALAVDAGGVSAPPQAAATTVHSPSITAFTIFIATPFSLPRSASAVRVTGKTLGLYVASGAVSSAAANLCLLRPSSAA